MSEIQKIVQNFAEQIAAVLEADAAEKARATVLAAFGGGLAVPKRRGRPPKAIGIAVPTLALKARKRAPVQLCPVPGCKNPAAPIFGMVCAKHKDLPKAKIKKYREARKVAKLKAAGKAPAPKTKRKASVSRVKPRRALAKKPTRKVGRPPGRPTRSTVKTAVPAGASTAPAVS